MIEVVLGLLVGGFVGFFVFRKVVLMGLWDEVECPLDSCDTSMFEECLSE